MKIERRTRRRPRIELIPMIDTMFFILIFFVVASLSMVYSRGLRVELPSATTGTISEKTQIEVTVKADGSLFIDQQPVTIEALAGHIRERLVEEEGALIVVNADESAEHGTVVAVMDSARAAGARALTIAVNPEDDK